MPNHEIYTEMFVNKFAHLMVSHSALIISTLRHALGREFKPQ